MKRLGRCYLDLVNIVENVKQCNFLPFWQYDLFESLFGKKCFIELHNLHAKRLLSRQFLLPNKFLHSFIFYAIFDAFQMLCDLDLLLPFMIGIVALKGSVKQSRFTFQGGGLA